MGNKTEPRSEKFIRQSARCLFVLTKLVCCIRRTDRRDMMNLISGYLNLDFVAVDSVRLPRNPDYLSLNFDLVLCSRL